MPVAAAVGVVVAAPGTVAVDRCRTVRLSPELRQASGPEGSAMGRQRRIPTRTCVICKERRQKDDLLRIVRTPEGQVVFDRTGRLNGRGAYICSDADHWGDGANRANRGRLEHALKIEIDESTMRSLNEATLSNQAE